MKKLKLKHIQAYKLGKKGVKVLADDSIWSISALYFDNDVKVELSNDLNAGSYEYKLENIQLILRPLSDIKKEIEHDGENFVPRNKFYGNPLDFKIRENSYDVVQKLLEWHFDVFGLIEKGLAVEINKF